MTLRTPRRIVLPTPDANVILLERRLINAERELSSIPRWVRAFFAWMEKNQICQPDPF